MAHDPLSSLSAKGAKPNTGMRSGRVRVGLGRRIREITQVAVFLLASCKSEPPPPPPISPLAFQVHKMEVERQKEQSEKKHVIIDGDDIQLPLTSGNLTAQERRFYTFYVWAYHPTFSRQMSLAQMWTNGIFNLELIGAKGTLRVPTYASREPPSRLVTSTNAASDEAALPREALRSRGVLEVEVRSDDLTRGFSIIGWFPEEYMSHRRDSSNDLNSTDLQARERNPWGERRDVKVYSGDLRTRVDIVDEREVSASFGKRFAKLYHVGRVFFRNRHPDKRLLVYTTSLRAHVMLYRPPIKEKNKQADLNSDQKDKLDTEQSKQRAQATNVLSRIQLQQLWDAGLKAFPQLSASPTTVSNIAAEIASTVIAISEANSTNKRQQAADLCQWYWDRMTKTANAWRTEAATAFSEAKAMADTQRSFLSLSSNSVQDSKALTAVQRAREAFEKLSAATNIDEAVGQYHKVTSATESPQLPDAEKTAARRAAVEISHLLARAVKGELLAQAFARNAPELLGAAPAQIGPVKLDDLRSDYVGMMARIRNQGESRLRDNGPFDHRLDILVNADGRPLAFSPDASLQRKLSEVGYVWRETSRPMTFQAILNSLMDTHEKSPKTQIVNYLESAARIAGGLVGLGTVVNELSSQAYAEGVTIYSTIVLPEVKKHLLEDLNKYVRNLGEMGMDVVMVIPPNDVVDRYVFFPKGPVYNHVDEFDVTDPAYIVRIDNDDVSVEATLIEQDVVVRGGGLESGRLVERALNEGRAEANAEMLKQVELKERLRRFELATLVPQIEAALAGTVPQTNNEPKSNERLRAEALVRKLVADFELRFGKDSTGIIAALLSKYGVEFYDMPPIVAQDSVAKVEVVAGSASVPFILPVSDDQTPPWRLQVSVASANPDRINPGRVSIILPRPVPETNRIRAPIQFTVQPEPNLPPVGPVETELDFTIKDDGGNAVHVLVPVTIQPPSITLKARPEGSLSLQTSNATAQAFKLVDTNLNQVFFLDYDVPLYASQKEGWKVAAQTSGVECATVQKVGDDKDRNATNASQGAALSGTIRIDPSLCGTNEAIAAIVSVTWQGATVMTNSVKLLLR